MPSIADFQQAKQHKPLRRIPHNNPIIKETPDKPSMGCVSIPFYNTIGPIFEQETGITLRQGTGDSYYYFINDQETFDRCMDFQKRLGGLVYLRDALDFSLACSLNFENDFRTELGLAEYKAKAIQDKESIDLISKWVNAVITHIPHYNNVDLIMAVPPRPDKKFDLPSTIIDIVSKDKKIINITNLFHFSKEKKQIKEIGIHERWKVWSESGLSYQGDSLKGKRILIFDDKYQSGTSINYVGLLLKDLGASKVLGLCAVKTRRDTDNS